MAMQLGAVRDALLEAGASPEKASKAAEELAAYDRDLTDFRSDLTEVKLLLRFVAGMVLAALLKLFIH